jgi:type II secretory pathway component GspD/PulD (secretin)
LRALDVADFHVSRAACVNPSLRIFVFIVLLALPAAGSQASRLYQQARKAEKANEFARAYILYSEAAALKPGDRNYWLRAEALRSRAAMQSSASVLPSTETDSDTGIEAAPEPHFDSITAKEMADARTARPPAQLKVKPGKKDLDLQGDSRSLFEQVAKLYGLEPVFDSEYTTGPRMRFRLKDADYREALHGLESATNSFIAPIADKLFIVAKDTPQKRQDLEQTMSVTVRVSQALTTQELTELAQAVRQAFNLEKLGWNSATNEIVMRDRVSRVIPAQQLLQDMLAYRADIMLELQFIEINSTDLLNYGITLPNSFPIVYLGKAPSATAAMAASLIPPVFGSQSYQYFLAALKLATSAPAGFPLNAGTLFGVGVTGAEMIANMTASSANTSLRADVRAIDGQPASFHIGDKYPVLTSGYFGPVTQGGQIFTPPPSYTFEDLGILLKMTPHIHGMDEVTIEIDAEFKVLGGGAVNGIPIISSRKITTQVRLRDDEYGIIAGLMADSDARTLAGIPGLAALPLLGPLFSNHTKQKDKRQVLVVIKPRLLSLPPGQNTTHALHVGSELKPRTPL